MESIKPLVWLRVSFVRSRAGFGFLQRDLLVPGVSRGVWHGLASPVGQSGSACPIDSTPREGAGDRFMVGMGAPCPGAARAPGTGLGPFSASLPFPPQQLTWSTLCSCRLFHSGGVPALPWGLRGFVLTFPEKRPVSGGLPLLPPLPLFPTRPRSRHTHKYTLLSLLPILAGPHTWLWAVPLLPGLAMLWLPLCGGSA